MKLMLTLTCGLALTCAADKINLWPEGKMPSAVKNQNVTPYVEFFAPEKATSDAILIVAPGGGYGGWAYDVEGEPVRNYFVGKGMNVAIFRYRTPRPEGLPKHLTAWQDAQRAVRIVRAEAAKRGYSPDKIGFMGFSAGGHLTLMTALSSLTPAYEPVDDLDKLSCSLNWAVPVYPAYALADGADGGNKNGGNDLATDVPVPEFAFDKGTPPMCLMHGDSDVYAAMGSVRIYHKLRTMGIPAELHIMAHMPHVFFRNCHAGEPADLWKDRVWEWLSAMGINTIHPCTYDKGWETIIPEYGKLKDCVDVEEGAWTRDAQNVITAHKDCAMWSKKDYDRFILDLEYKLDPKANSGVIIYASDVNNWIPGSVEVQLLDNPTWAHEPPRNLNAGLYGHLAPKVNNVKPAGEWNRMTIWADGKNIKVACNGELTVDANLDAWKSAKTNPDGTEIPPWLSTPWATIPTHGRVGFQGKHGGAEVHFRNIKIKKMQ